VFNHLRSFSTQLAQALCVLAHDTVRASDAVCRATASAAGRRCVNRLHACWTKPQAKRDKQGFKLCARLPVSGACALTGVWTTAPVLCCSGCCAVSVQACHSTDAQAVQAVLNHAACDWVLIWVSRAQHNAAIKRFTVAHVTRIARLNLRRGRRHARKATRAQGSAQQHKCEQHTRACGLCNAACRHSSSLL
jgi:hypothetical protein